MITLKNANKWFKAGPSRTWILKSVTQEIPLDTNIGILGKNGAGKSTFLRIISGIEPLDSGSVASYRRLSWPLGFSGGMHPVLTGEENCRFIARIYGASAKQVLDFVADFSELGVYLGMPVDTYSAGMRARLAFAISMAIEFEVYLVDELTAVGDKLFQEKCKLAFEERQTRSSVVMVSHNPGTIKAYCKRAAVLQDGALQIFETVREAEKFYESKLFEDQQTAKANQKNRLAGVNSNRRDKKARRRRRA